MCSEIWYNAHVDGLKQIMYGVTDFALMRAADAIFGRSSCAASWSSSTADGSCVSKRSRIACAKGGHEKDHG